ncbi:MAG: HEAT repeat domain-containing protein [Planctomycetota bacterium]
MVTNMMQFEVGAFLSRCGFAASLILLAASSASMSGCDAGQRISSEAAAADYRVRYGPLVRRVSQLLSQYQHPDLQDWLPRRLLIRDLGDTRDPRAYAALASILHHGDPQDGPHPGGEWYYAAHALAKIDDPRVFGVLKKAVEAGRLRRTSGVTAIAVVAALRNDVEALNYVLDALQSDPDEDVRLAAVRGLGSVTSGNPKHPKARAALRRAVRADASMRVRAAAACLLVSRGDDSYWPFVKTAAADKDPAVRAVVAQDLRWQEQAVPLLLQLLTDDDRATAAAAWEQLDKHLDAQTPYAAPPEDVETARSMAAAYREAWNKSRPK